jgi:hypothetical protein
MTLISPSRQPHERAIRYRALAYEVHRVVLGSTGPVRDAWVFIEREWEELALAADAEGDKLH